MATENCKPENKYPPKPCPCPEIPGPPGPQGPPGIQGPAGECPPCPSFAVTILPPPAIDLAFDLLNPMTAQVIGGTGPFTYLWSTLASDIPSVYVGGGLVVERELLVTAGVGVDANKAFAVVNVAAGYTTGEGLVSCIVTDTFNGAVVVGYFYIKIGSVI